MALRTKPTRTIVLGVPGSRRVERFQAALSLAGCAPAEVLPWVDFLGGASLADRLVRGALVRVESPGEHFPTWRALVALGSGAASREDALAMVEDRGRIRAGACWYEGFRRAMVRIEGELGAAPEHDAMLAPSEAALMFDKARCQRHLHAAGVPVPTILEPPGSFDELLQRLDATPRVFLKPRHGSSASGVMAIERRPQGRVHAWTSIELEGMRLYNNLRVRGVTSRRELEVMFDALVPDGLHLEAWMPKAGHAGRRVDLRVLCIGGEPRHAVLRTSRTPMTNLHLGNARGDLGSFVESIGPAAWERIQAVARLAARAFPRSLHVGLDIAAASGWRRPRVLEANAFGDLLPGVLSRGEETGLAELKALLGSRDRD